MQKCKQCGASWESDRMMDSCPFCSASLREKKAITTMEEAFMVIIENHGKETLMENGKLIGLLSDYAPALSRERKLVRNAIEVGAYKAILQAQEKDVEMVVNKYTSIMQRNYYIEAEWARKALMWCVSALENSGKDKYTGEDGLSTHYIDATKTYIMDDLDENINNNVVLDEEQMADFEIDGNVLVKYKGVKRIVQIPDGVVRIGEETFKKNNRIKKVILSNSVRSIESGAFVNCYNLKEILLPEGLIKIGDGAFNACSKLKEIDLPNSIKEIGYAAFWGCKSLKEIRIPSDVHRIGSQTFCCCYKLKEIDLPNSIKEIGRNAFRRCSSLKRIRIPSNVYRIEDLNFYYCFCLEEIDMPDSLKEIGYAAFWGCRSLKEIDLPDSLKEIGYAAFYGCRSLKEIKIPVNVHRIEGRAFIGCDSLWKIIVSRNTIIDSEAFDEDNMPTIEYYEE